MTRLDDTYGPEFYAETVALRHQYDRLGDAIHAVIPPGMVLDMGCGAGLTIARLQQLGHEVRGIEGSRHGVAAAPPEVSPVVTLGSVLEAPCLLAARVAICTEVAEHIPAEHADELVASVSGAAHGMIIWSAAPPGQGGVDHCNEQPPEYWLEKFAALGWVPDTVKTRALQNLMRAWCAQHNGAAHNFHVLVPA